MDMPTQAWVEQEILRISSLLEEATQQVRKRGLAAAEADTDYDIAFSQALKRAKDEGLTDVASKAEATIECAELLRARNTTEVVFEAAREAGRNFRSILDGLRSIGANLRPLVSERS